MYLCHYRKQKWLWSEGELFHLAHQMDIGDGKVTTTTEQLDLGVIMTCVNDLNLVDGDIGRDLWSCANKDLKTSSKKSNLVGWTKMLQLNFPKFYKCTATFDVMKI